MRGVAEVEPDGHVHPVEQFARHTAILEISENRLTSFARGDQPDVGGCCEGRLSDRVLVAVTLCRDHDDRIDIDIAGCEICSVDEI